MSYLGDVSSRCALVVSTLIAEAEVLLSAIELCTKQGLLSMTMDEQCLWKFIWGVTTNCSHRLERHVSATGHRLHSEWWLYCTIEHASFYTLTCASCLASDSGWSRVRIIEVWIIEVGLYIPMNHYWLDASWQDCNHWTSHAWCIWMCTCIAYILTQKYKMYLYCNNVQSILLQYIIYYSKFYTCSTRNVYTCAFLYLDFL